MSTAATKIVIMPLDISATIKQAESSSPDMQAMIGLMQVQQQAYANQINNLEIMINQYTWWIGLLVTIIIAIIGGGFTLLQFYFQRKNRYLLESGVDTLRSAQEAEANSSTQRDLGLYFPQEKKPGDKQAPVEELPASSIKKPKKTGGKA